jgi:hypothetical protein
MKKLKNILLMFSAMLAITISCKDEDIELVPEWESAVHGDAVFPEGASQNFVFGDMTVPVGTELKWISIDSKTTVTKIEVFALFNETYTDPQGIPATAKHGGDEGVLLATYEGSEVPGNREALTINITQDQIYNLYKDAAFDYDKDEATAATPVFDNPDKPTRSETSRFIKGDAFQLRWEFTTADGRVFDSWSPSVCNEFPDAACSINWGVICVSDLAKEYTVTTDWIDYYGTPGSNEYVETLGTTTVSGKYTISDLSGGMEPIVWSNPEVAATIVDECGDIKLDKASFSYLYGYDILSGSKVDATTGVITILWENVYGEHGTSVYTPN